MEDAAIVVGDGLRGESFRIWCVDFRDLVVHAAFFRRVNGPGQMIGAPMTGLATHYLGVR